MEQTSNLVFENLGWEINSTPDGGVDSFSADEVIDAYFKGKKDGINEVTEVLFEKLGENMNRLSELIGDLVTNIDKNIGIKITDVFMKILSPISFKVLLGVSQSDFIKSEILKVYEHISAFEAEKQTNTFRFSFLITGMSKSFSRDLVQADGYLFRIENE